ncbi:MAG: EAL domain-containing protein [Acidiphilium sp.]|nr:EAL domain-containing protein [Acidiphilium sp.]MDD4937202.1 EAL domain-containing protein [Acidiphilium sp.]
MDNCVKTLAGLETSRLLALSRYDVANAMPDEAFDRFTRLTVNLFDIPIALISVVSADQVLLKSRIGLSVDRVARAGSFCDATIASDEMLIVPDARTNPQFAVGDMVIGPPGIRFYAGAPLITCDGFRLGALSLLDTRPRYDFGRKEQATLSELARSVMNEMELRRQLGETSRLVGEMTLRHDIAAIAARSGSFAEALDQILVHAGRWLNAAYCAVPEADMATGTYHYVAAYATDTEIERIFRDERAAPARPLASLSSAAALTGQILVDSGPIKTAAQVAAFPGLATAAQLGTRRQITVPLTIADRNFGLIIGFKTATVTPQVMAFCSHLADWIAPLLQGRLREDALGRSNSLLDRSNRGLQTMLSCNEAIARIADEAALMQAICDRAVEIGRYRAAWVGMADADPDRTLRPVAMAGCGLDAVRQTRLSWADDPFGQGPSGVAIREGRPVMIADRALAPDSVPAEPAGDGAAIALPLHDDSGVTFGCLTLLAENCTAAPQGKEPRFDDEEVRLLIQLAADLAHGVTALRVRAARDAALADRHASEQHLARLLEASPTVIYALEFPDDGSNPKTWHMVEVSANLERLFGFDPKTALALCWWVNHLHPADRDAARMEERRLWNEGNLVNRYRFARADGTYRWVRDEKTLIRDITGRPVRIVGAWVDITESQQANEEIHRLAYFDPLTGLPNRAMLRRCLLTEIARAGQTGLSGALLYIDLHGFKTVNDLHGHSVGDIVLDQAGRRFHAALRSQDMVARIGGDEFVVLVAGLAEKPGRAAEIAHRIAAKLHQALIRPIYATAHECRIGANIGIAMFPQSGAGIDDILRQADIAMQQAKGAENTASVFFEPAMQEQVAHRHSIEQALREALANDRFEVWLQPQVNHDAEVVGVEALIRLRRADGVIVLPGEFIPVAEETGVVLPMGRWMLRAVCDIIAVQRAQGRPLQVAINVSPRQFRDPGFVGDVEATLAETGADPHDLMIEITESLLIDRIDETMGKLNALAGRGIRFSVDDFGTGYSSLGYLQNLPIAEIKIDRSFIHRLPACTRDATLAEAILAMTRHLGLFAVAEGVETEAQAAFLRQRGCNTMQGYLFGRPEPAPLWLERWANGLTVAPMLTNRKVAAIN